LESTDLLSQVLDPDRANAAISATKRMKTPMTTIMAVARLLLQTSCRQRWGRDGSYSDFLFNESPAMSIYNIVTKYNYIYLYMDVYIPSYVSYYWFELAIHSRFYVNLTQQLFRCIYTENICTMIILCNNGSMITWTNISQQYIISSRT
jgi:hypothetical protein